MTRVNVTLDLRVLEAAKASLRDDESLDQFVDAAVGNAIRSRSANAAFLARGLAAGEQARLTGQYVDSAQVIADLEHILHKKMSGS